jgi:hypothetical protein
MYRSKPTKGKASFELTAIMLLFALALTFFITFLVAYFNGNQVIVNVNAFNEAHIELVLFSAVIITGLVLIVVKAKEVRLLVKEKERKD